MSESEGNDEPRKTMISKGPEVPGVQVSNVLEHSCKEELPTIRERCSEWENKGERESVRGVDDR